MTTTLAALRTLRSLINGEFDVLTFFEILEAVALDRGKMHENIRL
jgi:hypothetical protein